MANGSWNGGKQKGRSSAKGLIIHNDKKERGEHEHSNEHIDKSLTPMNFSVGATADMTAQEKCARLDSLLDVYGYKEGSGKNKRVAVRGVTLYPPDELLTIDPTTGLWAKTPELDRWFVRAGEIFDEIVGEQFVVSGDVHYDEMHKYKNVITKDDDTAKPHLQKVTVPVIEDKNGKPRISSKAFSEAYMTKVNDAIDEMTRNEFATKWNTRDPRERPRNMDTETLKAESAKLEEADAKLAEADTLLDNAKATAEAIRQAATDKAATIRGDAQTDADATRKQADDDATEIRRKAKKDAEETHADAKAKGYEDGRTEGEQSLAQERAALDARKREVEERERKAKDEGERLQREAQRIEQEAQTGVQNIIDSVNREADEYRQKMRDRLKKLGSPYAIAAEVLNDLTRVTFDPNDERRPERAWIGKALTKMVDWLYDRAESKSDMEMADYLTARNETFTPSWMQGDASIDTSRQRDDWQMSR